MEIIIIIAIIWGIIQGIFTPAGFLTILILAAIIIPIWKRKAIKEYFENKREEKERRIRQEQQTKERNERWDRQIEKMRSYQEDLTLNKQFEANKQRVAKGYNLAVLLQKCSASSADHLVEQLMSWSERLSGETQNTKELILHPRTPQYPFTKGSSFFIGEYYQNDEGERSPLEWIVAQTYEDSILLISKYALEYKKYDENHKTTTWADCSLRRWLNGTFYSSAFSSVEKSMIISKNNITIPCKQTTYSYSYYSSSRDTKKEDPTQSIDKVFLLSKEEFENLGSAAKNLIETAHCKKGNPYTYSHSINGYWLRNHVSNSSSAMYVNSSNSPSSQSNSDNTTVVRPAIVVSMLPIHT